MYAAWNAETESSVDTGTAVADDTDQSTSLIPLFLSFSTSQNIPPAAQGITILLAIVQY